MPLELRSNYKGATRPPGTQSPTATMTRQIPRAISSPAVFDSDRSNNPFAMTDAQPIVVPAKANKKPNPCVVSQGPSASRIWFMSSSSCPLVVLF